MNMKRTGERRERKINNKDLKHRRISYTKAKKMNSK